MWQLFNGSFSTAGLIPHGYCLQWNPTLLWTLVASDSIIAVSYFSIPFAIWYFAKKRPDISQRWLFLLFGLFIIACGVTHFFDVLIIWQPNYWANAVAKVLTATFSLGTAAALWRIMPEALRAPSVQQLEYAQRELEKINAELELRVQKRTQDLENANNELKSALVQAYRFREALDHIPTSIYMKDSQHHYVYANKATLRLFKCTAEELIGCDDSRFFSPETAARLVSLDKRVLENGEDTTEEIDVREADGSRHVYWQVKTPIYDDIEQNRIWGLCGISTDITERKQMSEAIAASEKEFRALAESMPQIVWIRRADGWNIYFNKQWVDYTGLTLEESYGHGWDKPFHPDDQKRAWDAWQNAVNNNAAYSLECQLRRSDGIYRWWLIRGVPVRDDSGRVLKWFGTCTDIHEIKRNEESLQLAAMVYRASDEGIMVTDADDRIIAVNPAFTRITGYEPDEIIGKSPRILSSGRHDKTFFQSMWESLNTSDQWHGEIWNRRKDGGIYAELLTINNIKNEDGTLHGRVGIFSDISERKKSEEMIWRQANFDALTGLPNRRMVYDRLEMDIKKVHRDGKSVALMLIDLDRFKEVNDTLGHAEGDALLKETAQRIVSCVRGTDTVGRPGGDEFTIAMSELDDILSVERVAHSVLTKLSEPYQLGEELAYISASIGITLCPEDATDVATLFKFADQAMYAAKHQGSNRFNFYTHAMQDITNKRMRLVNDLHKALAEDQFQVYYQPIVDLMTGAIYKAEALIRWQHPAHGLMSPADFIPIAEETGLICDIGNWVFRQAAAQVVHCRANHHSEFQISVNNSPVQFRIDTNHISSIIGHLKFLGLPGQSIVIEITESIMMEAKAEISNQFLAFRDNGIQVALDDFGTGYSSLSYLKKFDIDYIKIDQFFVRNLGSNSSDLVLCEAIIVMAHKLGIKVIAEGVETQMQRDLLKQAGCDYGQGYLWSRPVPADEFEKLLSKGSA